MLYGRTFIDGGFRPAIAKPGRKWTMIVYPDGTRIRVKKVRSTKPITFSPIRGYDQRKLARRLLRKKNCLGLKKTITKSAESILREAMGETS